MNRYSWIELIVESARKMPVDSCVEWPFAKTPRGYGKVRRNKVYLYAHRISLELYSGALGAQVLHECDNPSCINPLHLRWGDQAENMKDMRQKGRGCSGPRNGMAKLGISEVAEIRKHYMAKNYNQYELAGIYGISRSQVGRIVNYECW